MDIIANKIKKLEELKQKAQQFDEKENAIKSALESYIDFCQNDFNDKSLNAIAKQKAQRARLACKALSGKMRNVKGDNE